MVDERADGEGGVALHLGLGIGEGAQEESEEVLREGGDLEEGTRSVCETMDPRLERETHRALHAVDNLGEGADGGRPVSNGALGVL